jgi:hypothetical protein
VVVFGFTTASALPAAAVGTSYASTLATNTGTGPITYALSAPTTALPDGLHFTPGARTTTIEGTPTMPGRYKLFVEATDSSIAPDTSPSTLHDRKLFDLNVFGIVTSTLPDGVQGVSYSAAITTDGGIAPYSWSLSGVRGLSIDNNGSVSGAPLDVGVQNAVVTVTDGDGLTVSKTLPIEVKVSVAVRLNPFGNQTLAGPYSIDVVDGVLASVVAPQDITVTLLREVISACRDLLFSSDRTVVIPRGQNAAAYDFNAAHDPFCSSLPIRTRYTLTRATLGDGTLLDLSKVPAQQRQLTVTR